MIIFRAQRENAGVTRATVLPANHTNGREFCWCVLGQSAPWIRGDSRDSRAETQADFTEGGA